METHKDEVKREFYDHLKKAIHSSLSYLKERAEKKHIQPIIDYDIKVDFNKKSWNAVLVPRYPLASFVKMHVEDILKLPEVVACMDFMFDHEFHKKIEMIVTDKNGKVVEDDLAYKRFLGYEMIIGFLMKYVDCKNDLDFDETLFNRLYDELVEYVYTEGREAVVIVPLYNFELKDIESVKLEDFAIRKLTEDEVKKLLSHGHLSHPSSLPYGGFLRTLWCIEFEVRFPSKRGGRNLKPDVERIITALRLFKQGALGYSTILEYPKIWETSWTSHSISNSERITGGQPYILTEEDIEDFREFWIRFKSLNIQNYPSLDLAIRRFNFSYDRKLPEDKLMDLIIAFEALFLPERDELSYRLALRCAYFLGENAEERTRIFEVIIGAYAIRSRIIHGDHAQSKSINKILRRLGLGSLTELVIEVEEYLRASIKKFIECLQSKSHKDVITEIDQKIIAGT